MIYLLCVFILSALTVTILTVSLVRSLLNRPKPPNPSTNNKFKYLTRNKTDDGIIAGSTWLDYGVGDKVKTNYFGRPISINYNDIKVDDGQFFIPNIDKVSIYNGWIEGKAWAVAAWHQDFISSYFKQKLRTCIIAFPKSKIARIKNKNNFSAFRDMECVKFIIGDDDIKVLKALISELEPSFIENNKFLIPILDDDQETKIRVNTNQEENIDLLLEKVEL